MFKYLVPSTQTCLGRIKKCGFTGEDVLLRVGFEVSKDHAISS